MKRYEPPAGWTVQAYRFALDPSDIQVTGLRRNTGAARFAYNHMLRRVSAVQAQRAAEAGYGVAEADLTPWQGWSLPDLRRTWNEIKQWVAPWWDTALAILTISATADHYRKIITALAPN